MLFKIDKCNLHFDVNSNGPTLNKYTSINKTHYPLPKEAYKDFAENKNNT